MLPHLTRYCHISLATIDVVVVLCQTAAFISQITYHPLPQQIIADAIRCCRCYFRIPYFKQPVVNTIFLDNLLDLLWVNVLVIPVNKSVDIFMTDR